MMVPNIQELDSTIESMLHAARIPGAAMAIVAGDKSVFAKGYGYRDLDARLPVTSETMYPIASTTKAMNATLLGMLVDEGRLAWDAAVQSYLPRFRLEDSMISSLVTVRDLVVMRTGLPRHDFLWTENSISRADMVECLAHLPLSAGFRERFQYNNLTPTMAGHIAEIVTGERWEDLIRRRLLEPLGMSNTRFGQPASGNVTLSYHENRDRQRVLTRRFDTEPIAPAGGAIHSTVDDMSRWIAFNLNGGKVAGCQLIEPHTLKQIYTPYVVMGADSISPSPNAAYGLGWFIDAYNGRARISHTGYLHDVNSCVTLFPEYGLGIVSFTNFASSRIASLMNQFAFDLMLGLKPAQTLEQKLMEYEQKIEMTRQRNASVPRVENTSPSHHLDDYTGSYLHSGYGRINISRGGQRLNFARNKLSLPLERWHYDTWVVAENDLFEIHKQHAFERANRIHFETNPDGLIGGLVVQLEPAARPARFSKL